MAFPLAPLLAFISNYVEMRVDALKLLDRCCRPEPRGAEDIGTWYPIMEILGIIAVMTNMASVIFSTSNPAFDVTDKLWMVWMFVILEVRLTRPDRPRSRRVDDVVAPSTHAIMCGAVAMRVLCCSTPCSSSSTAWASSCRTRPIQSASSWTARQVMRLALAHRPWPLPAT